MYHIQIIILLTHIKPSTIVDLDLGMNHSAILTSLGRVFIWGSNLDGQLGHSNNSIIPYDITQALNLEQGEKITKLSLDSYHSGVLTSNHRLLLWGSNRNGEIGIDFNFDVSNIRTPQDITNRVDLVDGEYIVDVNLGSLFTTIMTSRGRIFGFGYNNTYIFPDIPSFAVGKPTLIVGLSYSIDRVDTYFHQEQIDNYTPYQAGYTFSGWFINPDMTIPFNQTTMPMNDITLYGYFTKNK